LFHFAFIYLFNLRQGLAILLYSLVWPPTHYVAKSDLNLCVILLPLPPTC
jgi:hypothetical protein